MTNEEKAKEIYKDNLYDCEVRGVAQDKQEILFMLEKMAQWKDKQLWLLIDTIDHAYLMNDGTYDELSFEVIDKINYLKQVMKGE